MFKTTFSKYFSMLSLMLVFGVLLLGATQLFFSYRYWTEDKHTSLSDSAVKVAAFAAAGAQETADGQYYLHHSFKPYLEALTELADCHTLIVNTDGVILLHAGKSASPTQQTLPASMLDSLHVLTQERQTQAFPPATMRAVYTDSHYTVACPIMRDEVIGYVLVSASANALSQYMWSNASAFLLSALMMLLFTTAASYIVAERMARPLRQMANTVRGFATGDFSARVRVRGKDELAELGASLNAMADSLSSEEEVRRNFVANVSHELKTPMTTIAGFIDGILDGTVPPDRRNHYLKVVSDEVKRLSRLVKAMLDLSRIDAAGLQLSPVSFDLTETVGNALLSFEQRIIDRAIRIEGLEDTPRMPVCGDFDLLGQVVYNLLDNATKFVDTGGTVRIGLRHANGRIYCTVWNTGMGIPAHELPHIFERFYKTDKSRGVDKNGVGLGLYIVQNVIHLHGGEIAVRSVEGQYCAFEWWIPEDPTAAYAQSDMNE